MKKLRVLDLFSGIGGFSLGLERTGGFETVAFCEIEEFPRRVLAKHWPVVPCYRDVRELTAERLHADGIAVDVICGGFPCQDISVAGKGAGIADGTRSGLWSEIARLSDELRPSHLLVENVSALLSRGLGRVLGDLATIGYDAEWHCIPASALGAPHRRDRFWMVAHPNGRGALAEQVGVPGSTSPADADWHGSQGHVADAKVLRLEESRDSDRHDGEARGDRRSQSARSGNGIAAVADAHSERLPFAWALSSRANGEQVGRMPASGSWWAVEPDVGRVAHGVPRRVDRLRALGNAVVPQIPELIGNAILASLQTEARAA